MAFSLKDKIAYARKKPSLFHAGYISGVKAYGEYPKKRNKTLKLFNRMSADAKKGDQWAKGVLAGARDAAKERKGRKS